MDATELLKDDHDLLRELFARYGELAVDDRVAKAALFDRIRQELEAHAAIEEEIFYPAVRSANPVLAGPIVREAFEDNRLVRNILRDVGAGSPGSDEFDSKINVLRENVLHHAEAEEREVFAEAKSSMTPLQLSLLGGRLSDRKRELGGRVHRRVPVLSGARQVFSRVRRVMSHALRRASATTGRARRSSASSGRP